MTLFDTNRDEIIDWDEFCHKLGINPESNKLNVQTELISANQKLE